MIQPQYIVALIGLGFVWVIGAVFLLDARWRRTAPKFDTFSKGQPAFDERWTSGFGHRSSFSRIGGANNSLWVSIVGDELWVRPHRPFRWVDRKLDLSFRVPLRSIALIQQKKREVRLEFGGDTKVHPVTLVLRSNNKFIDTLKHSGLELA